MPDRPCNVGASVRQRLLNLAHARGQPLELLRTRFALERVPQALHGAYPPGAMGDGTPTLYSASDNRLDSLIRNLSRRAL